jgi:hypothetical protein
MRFVAGVPSALIFAMSSVTTCVLPVHAAEFGTRDEAVAMVRRVQEKFRKEGASQIRGKNLHDMRDQDAKFTT